MPSMTQHAGTEISAPVPSVLRRLRWLRGLRRQALAALLPHPLTQPLWPQVRSSGWPVRRKPHTQRHYVHNCAHPCLSSLLF